MSWSYEWFGKWLNQTALIRQRTKGTASTMSTLVDANTNRLSGFGYPYDANGNLLTMPQQSAGMTYDRANRMVTFTNQNDTESYQYAPDNKRVWRSKACRYQSVVNGNNYYAGSLTFYSPFGQKMGEYCPSVAPNIAHEPPVLGEDVYFGGRKVAKMDYAGNLTALVTDRLHSKGDGSTFFPYGETKSGAAITGDSFATYSRDWHGLDYADQRWYSPAVGRFTTSDPVQYGTNYYSYSSSDPINSYDPDGLLTIIVSGTGEQDAEWSRPGSEMHDLIQDNFQEIPGCVFRFDWSDSISGTLSGSSIDDASRLLFRFIDRLYSDHPQCGETFLNLVGYSHGGNVIIGYTHLNGARPIQNVVTLGTPSRLDFEIHRGAVTNFCAVSRDDDLVQFAGAHPAQLAAFGAASQRAYHYGSLAWQAALLLDFESAAYYASWSSFYATAAAIIMHETRIQPRANNFLFSGGPFLSREAHTTVRSPDAWRQVVAHPNWNCR